MGIERRKIELPDWLPFEFRDYVLDSREKLRNAFTPRMTQEQAEWSKAHYKVDDEIEIRLLTNPRMNEVWKRFYKIPEELCLKRMLDFLHSAKILYFEAVDRQVTEKTLDEREVVKALKRKVNRQMKNLRVTIDEADKIKGLYERKPRFLKMLSEIEEELLARINYSWKDVPPKTLVLGRASKAITSTKRMGGSGSVELVLKRGLPLLFEQIFGKKYLRLSRIVSLVMLNKPVPRDSDSPEQLRQQTSKALKGLKKSKK